MLSYMDDECIDTLLRAIVGEKEKEFETVKNCPPCFYKFQGYGGCEVYSANIRIVALMMPMKNIPELCPIREKILNEKAKQRRDIEEFKARDKAKTVGSSPTK
jgi:hypothetical protein